jgi:hypothetical protein
MEKSDGESSRGDGLPGPPLLKLQKANAESLKPESLKANKAQPTHPGHTSSGPRPVDSLAPARPALRASASGEFLSQLPKFLKSPLSGELRFHVRDPNLTPEGRNAVKA